MARDPNNIIKVDYNSLQKEIFQIENIPDFDIPDYDLSNPKEFPKYISSIENTFPALDMSKYKILYSIGLNGFVT